MAKRLIDADELKKAIETWDKFVCLPDGKLYPVRDLKHPEMFVSYIHVEDVIKAIDNAPTVGERPQGEWVNHRNDYGHNIADCSLCGKAMQWHDEDEDGVPKYCWYCGAIMTWEHNNVT